eukprot:Nk52_evm1s337 gene=Nk52_evmTU1s337
MTTGADNVRVCVRVRPFTQKERERNDENVITMREKDGCTIIKDVTQKKELKKFTFDKAYWSHDGYVVSPEGMLEPDKPSRFCDQKAVYGDIGRLVLENAWQGYNATVFAYGQTGSGKSYSMMGYEYDKGIIPMLCEDFFNGIARHRSSEKEFQLSFSMLEIYNEKIRDLLDTSSNTKTKTNFLKIREDPKRGFYVHNLKWIPVTSYDEMKKWMAEGNKSRSVASTNMNSESSRSHMVITLKFIQVFNEERTGKSLTRTSEINLVDLAGSERADKSGSSGDRLKEGSNINKSLSTLGQVISALAEKGLSASNKDLSKAGGKVIPYRDSVLTRLLKNALGGNSRTIMLATVSPSHRNYDESLSTLRYADRAKKIKNKAVVNEDPTDKIIRCLKEENAKLLKLLEESRLGVDSNERSQLDENKKQLEDMEKTWQQRLDDAKREWELKEQQRDSENTTSSEAETKMHPYIKNMNEDPQLSGVIKHVLKPGKTLVQRAGSGQKDPQSIQLRGLSILDNHAVFSRDAKKAEVSVAPVGNAKLAVNGKPILKGTVLSHLDRVMLGSSHLFIFIGFPSQRKPTPIGHIDWEFCQVEMAQAYGLTNENGKGGVMSELSEVKSQLVQCLPMISNANAISEEFKRNVKFSIIVKSGESHSNMDKSKSILIRVEDGNTNFVSLWTKDKFISRRFLIQELYQKYLESTDRLSPTEMMKSIPQEEDPFWDPPEDLYLGSVYLYLQSLAYQVDVDEDLNINNYMGKSEGSLNVVLKACDEKGKPIDDDKLVSEPRDMLGKRLDFIVKIPYGSGIKWLDDDGTRGVFCRFKFFVSKKLYESSVVYGLKQPDFNYKCRFSINPVTEEFINYLENSALIIEVYGKQGQGKARNGELTNHKVPSLQPAHSKDTSQSLDDKELQKLEIDASLIRSNEALSERVKSQEFDIECLKVENETLSKANSILQVGSMQNLYAEKYTLSSVDQKIAAIVDLMFKGKQELVKSSKKKPPLKPEALSKLRAEHKDIVGKLQDLLKKSLAEV